MSKKRQTAAAAPDPFAEMLSGLWAALAAGDVLKAEIETARCCSVPVRLGIDQDRSDTIFIGMAKEGGRPDDAALLRLIMLSGSPSVRRKARAALGELTAAGVYPANWVAEAGKAEPVRAARAYDVFGDWEEIFVTFRYAAGEHTLVARVDLAGVPVVARLALADRAQAATVAGPFEAVEEIGLGTARTHLHAALFESLFSHYSVNPEFAALIPIAKSRIRRLPDDDGATDAKLYTAEDRAALVRDFLASPHAPDDDPGTRFWAEILTAWSSRVPGHPPLQAGPRTLFYFLNEYAPLTYQVTPDQRAHMEAAVTGWARWSAAQRGLDEEYMLSQLPRALSDFAYIYDKDDYAAERRAYLADVVTADADIAELRKIRDARTVVIPPSDEREEDDTGLEHLDATDPGDRAAYLAADFAECQPPDGLSREEFLAVVRKVAEEVWRGEPDGTREQALALLAEGELDRHDIMHTLVRHALAHRA
jgi:hypothetical protein